MKSYVVAVEAEVKSSEINAIAGGLQAFNASHTGGAVPRYLVISLRDEISGELLGGLFGGTYLGWLHVQAVWLPEELRGEGFGAKLMALAEDEALRLECPRVFLETFNFQALGFYEKFGYVIASKIPDFPPGGARYALTKHLLARSPSTET